MQSLAAAEPVPPTYFPWVQPVHDASELALYFPDGHGVQYLAPEVSASPLLASWATCAVLPGLQGWQSWRFPADSAYFPAVQAWQSAEPVAVVSLSYIPASHESTSVVELMWLVVHFDRASC